MICFCHVLSERVKLKYYIGRICFHPPAHIICSTGSVTLVAVAVSSNVWLKNSLVSQSNTIVSKASTCTLARFRIGNWLGANYCLSCWFNKSLLQSLQYKIIDRFFAFNCCKKDQNNTENLSE